jgi:hypothetical protein
LSVDRVIVLCAGTIIPENALGLSMRRLEDSSTQNGDDAMMLDAAI